MCWFYDGNSQRLTESVFMERLGIEPATPDLQSIGLSSTPWGLDPWASKSLFLAFLDINELRWVGLRCVCWFIDGNTQSFTESHFMEKAVIEPATLGLQDIDLSPTPRRLLDPWNSFLWPP